MFSNIGRKIKVLAQVVCWVGIIAAVISGIIIMAGGASISMGGYEYSSSASGLTVLAGFLVILLGSLFSWIGSFVLYGFGELIESNADIRALLGGGAGNVAPFYAQQPRNYRSGGYDNGYNQPAPAPAPQDPAAAKRSQLKSMLDRGLITEDEYNAKIDAL